MKALALVALALASGADTAAAPARVIDSESVGAYGVTQPRARAIDVFGAPTYSADSHPYNLPQPDRRYCRTYWRSLSLVITYIGECSLTGRVRRVTVEGAGWRTREGLRIGDTVKRLSSVYRGARLTPLPSGSTVERWGFSPLGREWDLRRARPSSGVIVATASGRIVGFELRSAELRSG